MKRKNIKKESKVRTPTSYIKLKTKALRRLRLFLLHIEEHEAKRNRNYNIYTSKNTRLNESNLLTKAHFTGSMQLLFNLPCSLKMSPMFQGENTHFLHQAKNISIRTIKTLLITHRRTPCLRETETTTYTHRRTRG